ncbi:hypothetical protein [Streptomyces sp. NPDC059649]|uniref:zinc finger domain-containing protein n=1 Tax=Streptomyces sp. NPDC059649 TaxID=3346895 RepID=UPI0036841F72
MDRRQAAALLNYAAALDGRLGRVVADQQRAAYAIDRWANALPDVPATTADGTWDATRVVRAFYEQRGGDRSAQFYAIEPHNLLAAWATHRAELMHRHTDPTPDADPDNPAAWRAELLATRTAVATGQTTPSTHRELTAGDPHPDVAARLAALGSPIPPAVRQQLAAHRPTRAQREATVAAGRPDPLSVPCEWCGAQPEQPCRSRRISPNGAATSNSHRSPHPSRQEAAARRVAA